MLGEQGCVCVGGGAGYCEGCEGGHWKRPC